jgi:uncharacterized protein YecT (DUF1311 family)
MLKRIACFIAMAPMSVVAQDFPVDAGQVEACFDSQAFDAPEAACIGEAAAICSDTTDQGQTTLGLSQCMMSEAAAWDALLNREYKALRAKYETEPELRQQLQTAQRAWIAFRDADCGFAYAVWGNGSMRQIGGADCRLRHTARRTLELKKVQAN